RSRWKNRWVHLRRAITNDQHVAMRLHAEGHRPKQRIEIAWIDVVVHRNHHLPGGGIVADHTMERLPDVRLVDSFHPDNANLAHRDAVKGYLENAGNIALIFKKPEIISLGSNLAHHARFARRHLADDRGENRISPVRDAFHFEKRIEQSLRDVTRRFAERGLGLEKFRRDLSLDHDLGMSRHKHVMRLAFHDFDGRPRKPARDIELAHAKGN